ncbi:MAG: ParA family protein [Deltaproteobacteria bacterium]|nr:ParA family protein [Deltaproteobacteria bacterium]
MGRIVAVANQKGGVGKTTTAVNLGASLAAAEKRVLVVDIDPQGNASSGLGYPPGAVDEGVYDALLDGRPVTELTRPTELPQLTLLPAHRDLVGAELELVAEPDREQRLRRALEPVASAYDFIFVDTPPSLGLLTLNALVAADAVLIPMQCEYFALEGLGQLVATIEMVKTRLNQRLEIEGILLCMVDPRLNLTGQVDAEVRGHFDGAVFDTVIPRNVRLSESPSFGQPILLYDVGSRGAQSYLALAKEFLKRRANGGPR